MAVSINCFITIIIVFTLFQQGYCDRVVEHIGSKSITNFQLMPGYESTDKMPPIAVLFGVGSLHACQFECSQKHNCLSFFNYQPTKNKTCKMFDDIDEDQIKVGSGLYGKVINRRGNPFDCVQSTWSEWSCGVDNFWKYCGITNTSKVECSNVENRTREIIKPNEYGGVTCHTYEQRNACSNLTAMTHILLLGGWNGDTSEQVKTILDFVPELGRMVVLSQELGEAREEHTSVLHANRIIMDGGKATGGYFGVSSTESVGSMPLQHQALGSYISQQRYGGCSAVVGSTLYHCFGRKTGQGDYMRHCDVYDMADSFNHHLLTTDIPGPVFVSCLLGNNLLYVIGGFRFSSQNSVYKLNLMNGTKTALSSFPYAVYGVSSVWYHGNIVACGGIESGIIDTKSDCFEYNISSNAWDANFPDMTIGRSSFQMINWGTDEILAIGGHTGTAVLSSIEVYDGVSWTAYSSAQLPYTLRSMSAVVLEP